MFNEVSTMQISERTLKQGRHDQLSEITEGATFRRYVLRQERASSRLTGGGLCRTTKAGTTFQITEEGPTNTQSREGATVGRLCGRCDLCFQRGQAQPDVAVMVSATPCRMTEGALTTLRR